MDYFCAEKQNMKRKQTKNKQRINVYIDCLVDRLIDVDVTRKKNIRNNRLGFFMVKIYHIFSDHILVFLCGSEQNRKAKNFFQSKKFRFISFVFFWWWIKVLARLILAKRKQE